MKELQSNLQEKETPSILKNDFSLQKQTYSFSQKKDQSYQTGQMNQGYFFHHQNQQASYCPSLQCLISQIQVQKPILVVASHRCLITLRAESSIFIIDSNIADSIFREVFNVQQRKGSHKIKLLGTATLTEYSYEDFACRSIKSRILRRKEKIKQSTLPEIPKVMGL